VERLDESVTAMVLEKELSSSVAQNVARIPKNLQHEFALNIRLSNIPKVEVEKLVRMYFAYNTSDSLRNTIIGNPSLASALIGVTVETEKISIKSDAMEKFEGVLRLLLKLITEIEAFFAKLGQDQILKYSDLIHTVKSSAAGLIALIGSVSPGKPEKITGERIGGTDDNG